MDYKKIRAYDFQDKSSRELYEEQKKLHPKLYANVDIEEFEELFAERFITFRNFLKSLGSNYERTLYSYSFDQAYDNFVRKFSLSGSRYNIFKKKIRKEWKEYLSKFLVDKMNKNFRGYHMIALWKNNDVSNFVFEAMSKKEINSLSYEDKEKLRNPNTAIGYAMENNQYGKYTRIIKKSYENSKKFMTEAYDFIGKIMIGDPEKFIRNSEDIVDLVSVVSSYRDKKSIEITNPFKTQMMWEPISLKNEIFYGPHCVIAYIASQIIKRIKAARNSYQDLSMTLKFDKLSYDDVEKPKWALKTEEISKKFLPELDGKGILESSPIIKYDEKLRHQIIKFGMSLSNDEWSEITDSLKNVIESDKPKLLSEMYKAAIERVFSSSKKFMNELSTVARDNLLIGSISQEIKYSLYDRFLSTDEEYKPRASSEYKENYVLHKRDVKFSTLRNIILKSEEMLDNIIYEMGKGIYSADNDKLYERSSTFVLDLYEGLLIDGYVNRLSGMMKDKKYGPEISMSLSGIYGAVRSKEIINMFVDFRGMSRQEYTAEINKIKNKISSFRNVLKVYKEEKDEPAISKINESIKKLKEDIKKIMRRSALQKIIDERRGFINLVNDFHPIMMKFSKEEPKFIEISSQLIDIKSDIGIFSDIMKEYLTYQMRELEKINPYVMVDKLKKMKKKGKVISVEKIGEKIKYIYPHGKIDDQGKPQMRIDRSRMLLDNFYDERLSIYFRYGTKYLHDRRSKDSLTITSFADKEIRDNRMLKNIRSIKLYDGSYQFRENIRKLETKKIDTRDRALINLMYELANYDGNEIPPPSVFTLILTDYTRYGNKWTEEIMKIYGCALIKNNDMLCGIYSILVHCGKIKYDKNEIVDIMDGKINKESSKIIEKLNIKIGEEGLSPNDLLLYSKLICPNTNMKIVNERNEILAGDKFDGTKIEKWILLDGFGHYHPIINLSEFVGGENSRCVHCLEMIEKIDEHECCQVADGTNFCQRCGKYKQKECRCRTKLYKIPKICNFEDNSDTLSFYNESKGFCGKIFGADFETHNEPGNEYDTVDTFYVSDEKLNIVCNGDSIMKFVDFLIENGKKLDGSVFVFHNGSKYDDLFITREVCDRSESKIKIVQNKFIGSRTEVKKMDLEINEKYRITFIDSCLFIKRKLSDFKLFASTMRDNVMRNKAQLLSLKGKMKVNEAKEIIRSEEICDVLMNADVEKMTKGYFPHLFPLADVIRGTKLEFGKVLMKEHFPNIENNEEKKIFDKWFDEKEKNKEKFDIMAVRGEYCERDVIVMLYGILQFRINFMILSEFKIDPFTYTTLPSLILPLFQSCFNDKNINFINYNFGEGYEENDEKMISLIGDLVTDPTMNVAFSNKFKIKIIGYKLEKNKVEIFMRKSCSKYGCDCGLAAGRKEKNELFEYISEKMSGHHVEIYGKYHVVSKITIMKDCEIVEKFNKNIFASEFSPIGKFDIDGSYRGGYEDIINTKAVNENVAQIDGTMAYAAHVMDFDLPTSPKYSYKPKMGDIHEKIMKNSGFLDCFIIPPKDDNGFLLTLPVKIKNKENEKVQVYTRCKICAENMNEEICTHNDLCRGFRSVINSEEYRRMIKTGYSFREIYQSMIFTEKIEKPFKSFMKFICDKRNEYKENDKIRSEMYKSMYASFVGKLGSKGINKKIAITEDVDMKNELIGKYSSNKGFSYDVIGEGDNSKALIRYESRFMVKRSCRWISSLITASQRVKLMYDAESIGVDKVLTTMTDSIAFKCGEDKELLGNTLKRLNVYGDGNEKTPGNYKIEIKNARYYQSFGAKFNMCISDEKQNKDGFELIDGKYVRLSSKGFTVNKEILNKICSDKKIVENLENCEESFSYGQKRIKRSISGGCGTETINKKIKNTIPMKRLADVNGKCIYYGRNI